MPNNSQSETIGCIPQLPEKVSNDGREIWEWAGKMSEYLYRQTRSIELREQISCIGKCGDCCKWMTKSCPREINVKGRLKGPSMNAIICNQYIEKQISSELRNELQKQLETLRK